MKIHIRFTLLFALVVAAPHLPAAESAGNSQVLAAIQAAEASRGREFLRGNCDAPLQIGATLPVSDSGFFVTEIRYDAGLGQARFLLRSKANQKAPPFYAWCSYQIGGAHDPSASTAKIAHSASTEDSALGPVLVKPQRCAQLYLHSEHGSAILSVKPLQSGRKDELIRVRLPLHGKLIYARVIGPASLEAVF